MASSQSLPRAGGGVPVIHIGYAGRFESSPRRRGCSFHRIWPPAFLRVSPAHAGVFPTSHASGGPSRRFPRAGGGVPLTKADEYGRHEFSPRRRGCSQYVRNVMVRYEVSPAQAGVFPLQYGSIGEGSGFPRAGRGVPMEIVRPYPADEFPPRMQGCSPRQPGVVRVDQVSPAHAGVFLCHSARSWCGPRFPRAGGGVPPRPRDRRCLNRSSPRRRGCSLDKLPPRMQGCPPPRHYPSRLTYPS
jgi:hypothetical protein